MDSVILEKIKRYNPISKDDYLNATREIAQEIALYSLAQTDFFSYAAFCGGTALRIFYGLDRASEDLDFSLTKSDNSFNINNYTGKIKKTFEEYGFSFEFKSANELTNIQSAFMKGNTKLNFFALGVPDEVKTHLRDNEVITIKFEVDVNPPSDIMTEYKYGLFPNPYRIRVFSIESMFAGKLHAIIYRNWNNRVKGRDYYDLVYYIKNDIEINFDMLTSALYQTKNIKSNETLSSKEVFELLNNKISTIDFELAKKDVIAFIKNPDSLKAWSNEFFLFILKNYFSKKVEEN